MEKRFEQAVAIRGVFEPCNYGNAELIDGGIRENIPWKLTKEIGADKVICVIFEKTTKKKCCENIIDIISTSIDILCHELSNYELEGADYLLKIPIPETSLLDTTQIDDLFNIGYIQTKKEIENIKRKINNKK